MRDKIKKMIKKNKQIALQRIKIKNNRWKII